MTGLVAGTYYCSVSEALIVILIVAVVGLFAVFLIMSLRRRAQGDDSKPKNRDKDTIIREANRRLSQNPKDPDALRSLADLYYGEGDWEKALKTYSVLLNLAPTHDEIDQFEVNLRHGLSAFQAKNYEEAYKSLVVARTMKQEVFEINHNLGVLEYKRKNYEKAGQLLRAAVEQQPEHAESLRYLGVCNYRLKRYKEAVAYLRRVLDVFPEDKEILFIMGQCNFELGQNDQALRIFTHLRADPTIGPHAALLAGSIHIKQHSYDAAQTDFEIGLRHQNIRPDILLELHYRLAAAYTHTQDIARAIPHLQQIQDINPGYKDVSTQLARNRELNSNKNLQTFLIAPTSDFVSLCRRIAAGFFDHSRTKITDISVRKSEYTDVLTEVETAKWQDTVLFRFVRTTGTIGELLIRDLQSRIKDVRAGRGFCISAGAFSDEAKRFVEARLIDLIDKEDLPKLLKKLQ